MPNIEAIRAIAVQFTDVEPDDIKTVAQHMSFYAECQEETIDDLIEHQDPYMTTFATVNPETIVITSEIDEDTGNDIIAALANVNIAARILDIEGDMMPDPSVFVIIE